VAALWLNKHFDTKAHDKQCEAVVAAMIGIAPQDELEGMLAAQLVACHNASMECYRRAMIDPQSFEVRQENLKQKWLEMLKEIAPSVRRVAIMFNPDTAPGGGAFFLGPFEAAARLLAVEPITARVRSDAEIEAVIASLGREQAGLVIMPDSFMQVHQGTVISLTARNNLPAIGADLPGFAREGGLLSYGANFPDIFRRAAPYVDRILRGANPADLPVQAPTKYELVINLKTAKALGLDVPWQLQQLADEVIE
jgi:putative ABC transport system substrate-binding protein